MMPEIMVILKSLSPYSLALSRLPAPSSLPTTITLPLAMAKQRQDTRSLTMPAMLFAEAASSPSWPKMIVIMAKPKPHRSWFKRKGREYFEKRFLRSMVTRKTLLSLSLNLVLVMLKYRQITNPEKFEMVVARAAPSIPISGAPQRPKIKTALRMILRNTITTLAIVHCLTSPTFLRSVS